MRKTLTCITHKRRGTVLVYTAVALVAFTALMSVVVDVAHARLVKAQLQGTADAAARHAVTGLWKGAATSNATAAAAEQSVEGSGVVLLAADVKTGTWAGNAFVAGPAASSDSVEVTARRAAARGTAVQLWWGQLIGKTTADVTAVSVARGTPTPLAGFIGYATVVSKNNSYFGGYDSRTQLHPGEGTATDKARVGSNGAVVGMMNNVIQGDVVLGPAPAAVTGFTISGSSLYQPAALPQPVMPAWAPPGGVTTALTVSSNTVLPGGTYWFSSMDINADLTFSGPAKVYVNGDITIGSTLAAASGKPGDLLIYQYGAHIFGDAAGNGMVITASVLAPASDFLAKNNLTYYGSGVFNSITTKNNADFFYDTTLGPADGTPIVTTVK